MFFLFSILLWTLFDFPSPTNILLYELRHARLHGAYKTEFSNSILLCRNYTTILSQFTVVIVPQSFYCWVSGCWLTDIQLLSLTTRCHEQEIGWKKNDDAAHIWGSHSFSRKHPNQTFKIKNYKYTVVRERVYLFFDSRFCLLPATTNPVKDKLDYKHKYNIQCTTKSKACHSYFSFQIRQTLFDYR